MEINYTFYFFAFLRKMIKKLLTFCYWQDRKIHPRQRGCTLGCIQSAVHRQADDDGRTALAGIGRAQNRAVLLHPGFGQIPQLSGRYDLYPANPDAVPPSRPRTQRTLACAGALPDGRVREHFFAERYIPVGAGHYAFPRHFLLHHLESKNHCVLVHLDGIRQTPEGSPSFYATGADKSCQPVGIYQSAYISGKISVHGALQTGTRRISGLLQQPQNQGKTKGLAACNSQTTSPFGYLNNFYFKIWP